MKDIYQILREKEQAIARVRREVEALRFCAPMLTEAAGPLQVPENTAANRRTADAEPHPSSKPFPN